MSLLVRRTRVKLPVLSALPFMIVFWWLLKPFVIPSASLSLSLKFIFSISCCVCHTRSQSTLAGPSCSGINQVTHESIKRKSAAFNTRSIHYIPYMNGTEHFEMINGKSHLTLSHDFFECPRKLTLTIWRNDKRDNWQPNDTCIGKYSTFHWERISICRRKRRCTSSPRHWSNFLPFFWSENWQMQSARNLNSSIQISQICIMFSNMLLSYSGA